MSPSDRARQVADAVMELGPVFSEERRERVAELVFDAMVAGNAAAELALRAQALIESLTQFEAEILALLSGRTTAGAVSSGLAAARNGEVQRG
jgi:hypothetical protein